MAATQIAAADAVKFFARSKIEVQTARPISRKGEDGKVHEGFDVKMAALAEEHILAASDLGDRVRITTIDGQKYEAPKRGKGLE